MRFSFNGDGLSILLHTFQVEFHRLDNIGAGLIYRISKGVTTW